MAAERPSRSTLTGAASWLAVMTVALTVAPAAPANAAVTVARAEVNGTGLRLEGTALASRDITVDGVVLGRSDGSGSFRIERDPFARPPDCTVDVNDGSATATVARLSGCTVSSTPADTTPPTAPTDLTAALTGTTANLAWVRSTDAVGVTGYRVSRNGTVVATVTGTTFVQSNLSAGTHTYTVRAVDAAGNVSGPSNSAAVTVTSTSTPPADTTPPTAPTDLTAALDGTTANLAWVRSTDAVGVTGYRVSRNGTVASTVTGTTFVQSNLSAGTHTYTVRAVDAAGNVSDASNSAAVTVPSTSTGTALSFITPARLPDATVREAYLGYVVGDGGVTPYRFRIVSGRLPSGLQLEQPTLPSRRDARIIGTPSAVGTSTFTLALTDGAGTSVRRSFTLAVLAAPALAIPSGVNVLDAGRVGQSYSGVLPVSGGAPLKTWALTGGTLPPGLALGVGVVWGIPTTAGTYAFTARVTDSLGATASGQFSVTIGP